ncbi:MAG TPA: nucleoside-triphosphatase [Anaerolineales bacterium]|nr:nucleoside-triphosphatase [Anaerolineales bacterium]
MRLNWKGTLVNPINSLFSLASGIAGEPYLNTKQSVLWIITGARGAGKTSLCQSLVSQVRAMGISLGGVLSAAKMAGDQKVGFILEDLKTGEQQLLGMREASQTHMLAVGCWYFDPDVLAWGNECLQSAAGSDVVIFDECGFLELDHGAGFQSGLALIDSQEYSIGVVVVRPSLMAIAQQRWPDSVVIDLDRRQS